MSSPLYFVENDFGRLGRGFLELDRDDNSRADIVRRIRSKDIDPVCILEITEPCEDFPQGRVVNVTASMILEANLDPPEHPDLAELRQNLIDCAHDHRRKIAREWVR